MNGFRLVIATAKATLHDGDALHCAVTTPAGRIGLEAHHEPFLCVLREESEILYTDADGEEKSLHVRNGLLAFQDNRCTVAVSV